MDKDTFKKILKSTPRTMGWCLKYVDDVMGNSYRVGTAELMLQAHAHEINADPLASPNDKPSIHFWHITRGAYTGQGHVAIEFDGAFWDSNHNEGVPYNDIVNLIGADKMVYVGWVSFDEYGDASNKGTWHSQELVKGFRKGEIVRVANHAVRSAKGQDLIRVRNWTMAIDSIRDAKHDRSGQLTTLSAFGVATKWIDVPVQDLIHTGISL